MENNSQLQTQFCFFNPQILKADLANILKTFTSFLNCNIWDFGDRKYRDLNVKLLFDNLQKTNIHILWLDYNKKTNILKQIMKIQFTNLETIFLGDNSILNIEDLSQINFPNIKSISLNDNLIIRINAFKKCKLQQIQYLSLNGNKIREYQSFQCFPMQNMNCLSLQNQKQKQWTNLASTWSNLNLSWMIKTQIKHTSIIKIYQNLPIKPQTYLIKLKIRRNLKPKNQQLEQMSPPQSQQI